MTRKPMTDAQAMRLAVRMSTWNDKILALAQRIEEEHPAGRAIMDALERNAIRNPARADDVIRTCLEQPGNRQGE